MISKIKPLSSSESAKKTINRATFVALVAVFLAVFALPFASAKDGDPWPKGMYETVVGVDEDGNPVGAAAVIDELFGKNAKKNAEADTEFVHSTAEYQNGLTDLTNAQSTVQGGGRDTGISGHDDRTHDERQTDAAASANYYSSNSVSPKEFLRKVFLFGDYDATAYVLQKNTDTRGTKTEAAQGLEQEQTETETAEYKVANTFGFGDGMKIFQNVIIIVACGFTVLIALLHFFENIKRGQNPVEEVLKAIIEIALMCAFMMFLPSILGWLCKLVFGDGDWEGLTAISNYILQNSGGKSPVPAYSQIFTKSGFFVHLGYTFILIIPYAVSLLLWMGTYLLCYGLLIELAVRRIFAPFAAVDIVHEGMRSPGVRYLKKYLAAMLKSTLMVIINIFGTVLIGILLMDFLNQAGSSPGQLALLMIITAIRVTAFGLMVKAGSFSDDIVGAIG